MHFGAAGHEHGDFFTEEEIGMFAENLRAIDGIVVGEGDDGHAESLATCIDIGGLVV